MKKFGTPNGAGPGNANEYVGFVGTGTPPDPRNWPVTFLTFATTEPPGFDEPDGEEPVCDPFPDVVFDDPCRPGLGAFDGACRVVGTDLVVPVAPVVVPVAVGVLPVVGAEAAGPLVVPAPPVVPDNGTHDSLTPATGVETGNDNADTGVPAGTSSTKLR